MLTLSWFSFYSFPRNMIDITEITMQVIARIEISRLSSISP